MLDDNFKLVSNMILRAADYGVPRELAKLCPVLKQGGMIEIKQIQPRAVTTKYAGPSGATKK